MNEGFFPPTLPVAEKKGLAGRMGGGDGGHNDSGTFEFTGLPATSFSSASRTTKGCIAGVEVPSS